MRARLATVLLLAAACPRNGSMSVELQPVRPDPLQLDLGAVALHLSASRSLRVDNPNRTGVDLAWSLAGPFDLKDAPARVGAGSSVQVDVSFTPATEGAAAGTLSVNGIAVALTASGFDPHCLGSACTTSTYDPAQGACVTALKPDGTDCGAAFACLTNATCQGGQCVGDATACSDGNPCTLDVCGTTGCGHVDALPYCPEPDDPCQVPSCDVDAGCGATAAPDGTDCGPRDCHNAHVCIAGACVVRPVPSNQSCVDVVAGVPAGTGTADGQGALARFSGGSPAVYDAAGNRYQAEGCELRKVTPGGLVRTLAGKRNDCETTDGFGSAARFNVITGLVFDGVNLVVLESCALRKVTLSGLVSTWVGDGNCTATRHDGIGRQAALVNFLQASEMLVRVPGGALWLVEEDPGMLDDAGLWLREVSPNGEVFTHGRLQVALPTPDTTVHFDALVAAPDGRLYASVSLAPAGPGGATWSLLEVLSSGATLPSPWSGPVTDLAPSSSGFIGASNDAVYAFYADGGMSVVAQSPALEFADGPLDGGARFGWPSGLAQNAAGEISFVDGLNFDVRLISGDTMSTLAGPRPDRRIVDGQGAGTRLKHPGGITTAPSGTTYFSDEGCLRRLDTADRLSTLVANDGGPGVDGPFTATGLSPGALSVRQSGDLLFADGLKVRLALLNSAWVTTMESEPHTIWSLAAGQGDAYAWIELDTQLQLWLRTATGDLVHSPLSQPQWIASDPAGGYLVSSGACTLGHLDLDGGWVPVDCTPESFEGATVDGFGNVYLLHTFDNTVWKRTPAGMLGPVLELADHPLALSAEPSGSVLILVPEAILRFHP